MYHVLFRSRFERVFKKLDHTTQRFILNAVSELAKDPFSHPNIRLIIGTKQKAYRLRIGRWRVLYFVITKEKTIEIIDLFLRKGRDDYKG